MIGKLRGTVDTIGEDFVILDVNGVGYVVHCAANTLQNLKQVGDHTSLAIETQVREDSIRLYGFLSDAERDWFRLLQTVQGVGAKVALAILGILNISDLAIAIATQDKATIARAPGIGAKLAARLITELKDKVGALEATAPGVAVGGATHTSNTPSVQDAIAALMNLGYGRAQAINAIAASRASLGEDAEAAALIRRGLRELAR